MDPATVAIALTTFGIVTKGLIDVARRQWPRFDGGWVQAGAVALGTVQAALFDIRATEALLTGAGVTVGRVPADPLDWLITGGAIAFAAGLFAEVSGRSGNAAAVVEVDSAGRLV